MVVHTGVRTAYFYGRVSTERQAGDSHSSLETQEERARAYCQTHGLSLVASFIDVQSGRRDDRTEYRRMVDSALIQQPDVIAVQWLDRFGRNPREILSRIWQLKDHGIEVIATDEDIGEELILLMRAGLAGAESRRNSERVRSYMSKSVSKGVHMGRAPFGYRRTKINDVVSWDQEPEEARGVREMYRLAVVENLGYKAIADRLSETGYSSRGRRPWGAQTVKSILTNEAIAGVLVYGRKPKPGNPQADLVRVPEFFPAILTNDEWAALKERLDIRREHSRGGTHRSEYLLSGIVRCGHCGGPMTGKVGYAHKGRRYRNYWCSNARNSRARCAYYNGHAAPKLEAAILEHLGQYSDPKKVRELLDASEKREVERREAELRQVERRMAELEADFAKNLELLKREVLNEEEFRKANEARRDERTRLEGRQAELAEWLSEQHQRQEAVESLPARVGSFLEDFQSLDVRRAKALLQTILKAARVYRDDHIELEFRS